MADRKDPRIARSLGEYVTSPRLAIEYDRHYENTPLLEFDTAFLEDELTPPGRVLDIGCGTGRHLVSLSTGGHRLVGMDLSAPMLDLARKKLATEKVDIPLVRADMRAPLPFGSETFDHVVCMFSTMGLIPSSVERSNFISEVARVLRLGGTFVLHVHNRFYNLLGGHDPVWLLKTYTWDRLFTDLEVGDRIMRYYRGVRGMYLHVFSLGEVKRLLASHGLSTRRVVFLNDDREGEITGWFKPLRANGFFVSAEKGRRP